MRVAGFVRHAAERIAEMYADGYHLDKMVAKMRNFLKTFYKPHARWKAVFGRIASHTAARCANITPRDGTIPRRASAKWAVRQGPRGVTQPAGRERAA